MMQFKAFHSLKTPLLELKRLIMIRKGQLSEENIPAYK